MPEFKNKKNTLWEWKREELENIGAFSVTLTTSVDEKTNIPKLNELEVEPKGHNLLTRVWFNYFHYINAKKSQLQYYGEMKRLKVTSDDLGQWLCNLAHARQDDNNPSSVFGATQNLITEWWNIVKEAKVHYHKSPITNPFLYEKIKKKGDRVYYYLMRLREDVKHYTPVAEKRKVVIIIRRVDTVDKNDEITQRVIEKYGKGYANENEILEDFEVVKKLVELYDKLRKNALANINYLTKMDTVEYAEKNVADTKELVMKNPKKKQKISGKREIKLYPFQPIQSNQYEKSHYPTEIQFQERFYKQVKEKLSTIPNAKFHDLKYLCEKIYEKKREAHNESRASWIMERLKKD